MATLVKIRGLDRGPQVVGGDMAPRGLRVNSGLGQQFPSGVKASLTPTANTQTYTALYGGTYGNNIRVATAVGTLGVTVAYTAATGQPTITVTAPATATLAANQAVVAAVNAHPEASLYVVASVNGTGAAAHAAVGAANLTGGTDVGTGQPIVRLLNNRATIVVDVDDPATAKALRRNAGRWVSLGAA
jgi:hypothetical protein